MFVIVKPENIRPFFAPSDYIYVNGYNTIEKSKGRNRATREKKSVVVSAVKMFQTILRRKTER